jgi:amino acid transporter
MKYKRLAWLMIQILSIASLVCGVGLFIKLYIYKTTHVLMSDLAILIKFPVQSALMVVFIFIGILGIALKEKIPTT